MKPVDSSDDRVDWDVVVGLAWIGRRHSRTETLTVSIPDTSRELTQQTPLDHFRVPTTPDDRVILFDATTIHEPTDRANTSEPTQLRTLSTDRLLRHTHLQQVAFGLPVYRFGGGWC